MIKLRYSGFFGVLVLIFNILCSLKSIKVNISCFNFIFRELSIVFKFKKLENLYKSIFLANSSFYFPNIDIKI